MADLYIPAIDYGNEKSSVTAPVADAITDLNVTDLFNAIDGVSLAGLGQSVLVTRVNKDDGGLATPANAFAQRELKWLVRYHDATDSSVKRTMEIPCADASLLAGNTDFMDLSAGAGATFKTSFESHVKIGANAVVVDSVELVGRTL